MIISKFYFLLDDGLKYPPHPFRSRVMIWEGQVAGSRSGSLFRANPSFLQGFIRVLYQKGAILGPSEAALEPGRTSTWAQARPAGGWQVFFVF